MSGEREPAPERTPRPGPAGLCPECALVRRVVSDRGAVFWLCELSRSDPRFPRYPAQPRMECPGFRR